MKFAENETLSLKQLLESVNAFKHLPLDAKSLVSVDTIEESEKVMQFTNP
jgi:hypothetical protein